MFPRHCFFHQLLDDLFGHIVLILRFFIDRYQNPKVYFDIFEQS